jgi:hypothetical protein
MAIEMIAAGHKLEAVIDITGVDPELLYDVLTSMLGEEQVIEVKLVETLQHFHSETVGIFKVNMN